MASYEDIRAYFDGTALFKDVVRIAARVPIVTGFTLDIDPLWGRLYDIENNLEDPHDPFRDNRFLYAALPSSSIPPPQPYGRGYRRRDLRKPVSMWKRETEIFRQNTGRERLPVTLTVVHRPLRAARPGERLEEDDTSLLQQLVQSILAVPVLVRIEERPRAPGACERRPDHGPSHKLGHAGRRSERPSGCFIWHHLLPRGADKRHRIRLGW
jgi:hypothetical protein